MNWQIAVAPPPGGAARGQVLPVVHWTLAVPLTPIFSTHTLGLLSRAEIMVRRLLLLSGLLLASGCAWPVRQTTDHVVCDMVNHPFDIAPEGAAEAAKPAEAPKGDSASSSTRSDRKSTAVPEAPTDVQTSALLELQREPARRQMPLKDDAVQTAAWTQTQPESRSPGRQAADTGLAYPGEAAGVGGAGDQDTRKTQPRGDPQSIAFIRSCRPCRSSRRSSRGRKGSLTRWPTSSAWPPPTAPRCGRRSRTSRRPRAT